MRTEDYRREFLQIFFAQRPLILGTTAVVVVLGLLIALFWPRTYAAYGSILVRATEAQRDVTSLEATDIRSYPVTKQHLFSEVELIRSPEVIHRALTRIDELGDAGEPPYREIAKVSGNLESDVIPASNVIRLTLKGRRPERTREILEEILTQYVVFRSDVFVPRSSERFFADRAQRFHEDMQDREGLLVSLMEDGGSADPGKEIEINLLVKQDLEARASGLRTELVEQRRMVEHLDRALGSESPQYFSFIDSPTIGALAEQLAVLRVERGNLYRKYAEDSVKVVRMDEQIEATLAQLRSEVSAYRSSVSNTVGTIEDQIANIEDRIAGLDERNLDLKRRHLKMERVERDVELSAYAYETFAKRRNESRAGRVESSAPYSGFVSVLEHAYPSNGPVFPRAKVVVPMSVLVGLLAGFSLGFVREYFDHTFKTPRDVEQYAALPLLFSVEERQELS